MKKIVVVGNGMVGYKFCEKLRAKSSAEETEIIVFGEEPLVAAAIVDIFASLPHASHFVEPLVKTCIKLEATLPAFKARFSKSPYREPLARYLNKHPQYAVSFFFQRLKTPMYSELFQRLVEIPESSGLRSYLNSKQISVMILNVCFERPLAIIRSEKSAPSGLVPEVRVPTLRSVSGGSKILRVGCLAER